MKCLLILITAFLSLAVQAAAPPSPTMIGMVGAPTNGFWLTNVTFVYTNAAVRTPTIDLGQVTVYGTNSLKDATILAWSPPTNGVIAGYKLYYGKTGGTTTNTFLVSSNITCTLFYSSLATNTTWWAYVTARDSSNLESVPSEAVVFQPR